MNRNDLLDCLTYCPDTGILSWKKAVGKAIAGDEAGYVSKDGYRYFGFKGKTLKTHRAIYLMVTGTLPPFVDHENHIRTDNRWGNLKAATIVTNNRNCSLQQNNKSGVVGVSWSKSRQKWVAMIWHNSKPVPLGRFVEKDDAILARQDAEKLYGYHANHGK